ncbi:MAG: 30S ribosomal protein S12 methylthiotransferase RimO, partial [Fibrobacteres bacterium]|nr:30S ribosomal protein S12 methylthiotransferase RimO [Fibrobacterota bacterium]
KLRTKIPDITIRTTFLTGFPGESAADFKELMVFVNKTKFGRMGAFAYSPEEGTAASRYPNRPSDRTVKNRVEELMFAQNDIIHNANVKFIGKTVKVIVDEIVDGVHICRTERDAPEVDCVLIAKSIKAAPGEFRTVKVKEAIGLDLYS